MKKQFEKREKEILTGLLTMLVSTSQSEKMKKEYKFSKKLWDKFTGPNLEVNLKPDEVKLIKNIVNEVLTQASSPVKEGELPTMLPEDVNTCKQLFTKLV